MDDVNTAIAPVGWDPDAVNPSTGAPFDSSWSGLVFLSREDDQFTNGRRENGLYCASFGRKVQNLENRVADFLRYEAAQGRRTMVASQFELEIDAFLNDCLTRTPEAATVRASDPRYVVHSTSQEAWASISQDKILKSPVRLREEGVERTSIGFRELGEPPEYEDYIHFGAIDKCHSEFVVLSQQRGASAPMRTPHTNPESGSTSIATG